MASADHVQRRVRAEVRHLDATVAITLCLQTKRKVSSKEVTRNCLLGYCRNGRRLAVLAGRAPLMVFVFPQVADTIAYVLLYPSLVETHEFQRQNNSITESGIRALAARIKQNHPELTRTLMGLGKYTGLTSAHTVRNIPQLEDVVAKTYHVLGSALTDIPTGVISSNQVERNKLWGELTG